MVGPNVNMDESNQRLPVTNIVNCSPIIDPYDDVSIVFQNNNKRCS